MDKQWKAFQKLKIVDNASGPRMNSRGFMMFPGSKYRNNFSMFQTVTGETRRVIAVSDMFFALATPTYVESKTSKKGTWGVQRYHHVANQRYTAEGELFDTGEDCLLSKLTFLRAPVTIAAFWAIVPAYTYETIDRDTNKKVTKTVDAALRLVELPLTKKSTANQIFELCLKPAIDQHQTLVGLTFNVIRTSDTQPRIGSSWNCVTGVSDPATRKIIPHYTPQQIEKLLASVNAAARKRSKNPDKFKDQTMGSYEEVYPSLTNEDAITIVEHHLTLCEQHNWLPNCYSPNKSDDVDAILGSATEVWKRIKAKAAKGETIPDPSTDEGETDDDPTSVLNAYALADEPNLDDDVAADTSALVDEVETDNTTPSTATIVDGVVYIRIDDEDETEDVWVTADGLAWKAKTDGTMVARKNKGKQVAYELTEEHLAEFDAVSLQDEVDSELAADDDTDGSDTEEGAEEDESNSDIDLIDDVDSDALLAEVEAVTKPVKSVVTVKPATKPKLKVATTTKRK